MAVKVELELLVETCITCGVSFGVPYEFQRWRKAKHEEFFCPNGHRQYYPGETEEERLRKLFLKEQQKNTQMVDELAALKKRVDAGMCPHCHRHFLNVARHLKAKHNIGE
mgnify:CR=1 FL=1